ncbi:MAG: hypothetical protein U0074_24455 [Kouleothrix sp.]
MKDARALKAWLGVSTKSAGAPDDGECIREQNVDGSMKTIPA